MIGRGLRLHPGKKECLVLEFTSNDRRMLTLEDLSPDKGISYVSADTFKENVEREKKVAEKKKLIHDFETIIYDPLDLSNKPIFTSVRLDSENFFIPHHYGFFWGAMRDDRFYISEFEATKDKTYKGREQNLELVFDSYLETLEQLQQIMKRRHIRKFYPPDDGDEMTDRQKSLLIRLRVPCEEINKREASRRIEKALIAGYLNKNYRKQFPYFDK